jgi:hypothetical protein
MGGRFPWVAGTGLAGALTQGYYMSPLRGVIARFISRNSTFPFSTIALISRCPPQPILFL